jgi:hypothetical protein
MSEPALVIGRYFTAEIIRCAVQFVKHRVNPGLGFGQLEGIAKKDVLAPNRVINQMFGLAA